MPAADWARGVREVVGERTRVMTPTARSVAVETVRRVTDEDAYSTRVLPALLARSRLDAARPGARDGAGLRHAAAHPRAGSRDRTRGPSRSVARMSPGARAALRLGAYQLLFMRIPRTPLCPSRWISRPRESAGS